MTATPIKRSVRRIVVALDASEQAREMLQMAARLAARVDAELAGMFVEDVNLLRLAKLPFAREIRLSTATEQALSSQGMEREFRALANEAERAVAAVAQELEINWSFRVVRGRVESALRTATLEADLLTFGLMGSVLYSRARLGLSAREIARWRDHPRAAIRRGAYDRGSVCVFYGSSAGADETLAAAVSLAELQDSGLTVFIQAQEKKAAEELEHKARTALKRHGRAARFQRLTGERIRVLADIVEASGGDVLVIGGEDPLLEKDGFQQFLEQLACPVLIVRK